MTYATLLLELQIENQRYGEDVAEVAVLDGWKCPRCRGICNCSICMIKRGRKPIGFLKSKKLGCSSVNEMLLHRTPELLDRGNTVRERDLSNGSSSSVDAKCAKKGKSKTRKDKEKHHEGGASHISQMDEALLEPMIPQPEGTALTTVAGINNIPMEVIGDTLQFLEFCAAFEKLLDFTREDAKYVIGEILLGRSKHRGRVSLAVQFQHLLLSIIQEDLGYECSPYPTDGKHSWLKEFSPDFIDEAVDNHELDFSKKIRILNFLCDEALNTEYFRSNIDEQNNKFIEMVKGTKVNLQAARDKEKLLKQKLGNENGNVVTAEGGAPDPIPEHESIASQMKDEISQTQAEILEMTNKLSEKQQAPDVIRTEPVIVDADGRVFWKLKTYTDEPGILLQEIGNEDSVTSDDKWFFFDADKKSAIDGYISSLRRSRKKFRKHVVL